MKKISLFSLSILICFSLFGQQAIVPSGGNATGAGGVVSYTVGQTNDMRLAQANGLVAQGIQQPAPFFTPLPISLTTFDGRCEHGVITLNWLNNANTNRTMVQRSEDGSNWTDFHLIKKQPTNENIYWKDSEPFENETYYRLRFSSFDEEITYSNILLILNCERDIHAISIFPNPADAGFFIRLNEFEETSFRVFDMQGKQLLDGALVNRTTFIDTDKLPSAHYLLSIYHNQQIIKSTTITKK